MLTKQHRFARRITDHDERVTYRTHMCGLCHALGDGYGLAARLLTSHEMILLNLLTSAQTPEAPPTVTRRCPLNPLRKVNTNPGAASTFAAAASVTLASISVADDIEDSAGRDLVARTVHRVLDQPQRMALRTLEGLGFRVEALTELGARQAEAERAEPSAPSAAPDASQPSAVASAALFAMTAQLAGMPQNAEPLTIIGASYGAYLYLMDALRDFPADMCGGAYNPLRRFWGQDGNLCTLSIDGLTWLLSRFEKMQATIRGQISRLHLIRYQRTIRLLLTEPIDKIVFALWQQVQGQRGLAFAQLHAADLFKAALFVTPPIAAAPAQFTLIQTGAADHAQGDWAGQFVAAHAAQGRLLRLEGEEAALGEVTPDELNRKRSADGICTNCGSSSTSSSADSYQCLGAGCDFASGCGDNNGCESPCCGGDCGGDCGSCGN